MSVNDEHSSDRECPGCGEMLVWIDEEELYRCYNCGTEVEGDE